MTTDPTIPDLDADRAARLAALRERSLSTRPAPTNTTTAELTMLPAERRSPRRRHAAMGARVLTAGLSITAAVGLIGLMADGQVAITTAALATPSPTTTAVAIVPGSTEPGAVPAPTTAPVAGAPPAPVPGATTPLVASGSAKATPAGATAAAAPAARPASAPSGQVQASGGAAPSNPQPAAAPVAAAPATAAPAPAPAPAPTPAPTTAAPAPPPPPVTTAAGS